MEAAQVKTADDVRRVVEARGLDYVKVGFFDIDGVLRGKWISKEKLGSVLDGGMGYCDVVLGWDSADELYDAATGVTVTGWHSGFPDGKVRLVPETCREVPFEFDGKGLLFLLEFDGGAPARVCPRNLLGRIVAKAKSMGYGVKGGLEYEFFLFDETPDSVRAKNYQDLKNLTPGMFGYSVLRTSVLAEYYIDLLATSRAMGFPIEGFHTETGPGVVEAALSVAEGVDAADRGALFKTFAKVVAQRHKTMATFMAKWSNKYPGQSGHLHLSLTDAKGKSAFHDAKAEHGISTAMRHFIGGCQALMPELLCMIAPTINSFTRLIPGFWAPTNATWGIENRTTALRAIPGSAKSQRLEYRVCAADGNPYIVMAAALGSGLWGIEHAIEPTAPSTGNAYEAKVAKRLALPTTLWEAAQRLRASKPARSLFGDDFVEHFAGTREWEEREFRKAITDWELRRYFEII
ncbi:MAG: glutamine synthetase family protein [Alphaproteobacteria bacterium]